MKSTIISTVLAVVATTSASAVSIVPRVRTQSNFVWSKNVHRPTPQIDQMCIHFENSVDTWYYSFQGPWGQSSGQASNEGDICVPTSNDAGGAMFIGLEPNPGPGSTKFECFFPTDGTANCDVSLVDGYSTSVFCLADGAPTNIGGGTDLYTTGYQCPDQEGSNCLNPQGYAPSESDVSPFFEAGTQNGNQYCVWVNCSQDYYFPTGNSLNCAVLGH